MDRGRQNEIVLHEDVMPPLEEVPEEEGEEDANRGDIRLEEVAETEAEHSAEIDFYSTAFECDVCRAAFATEMSLIQHQNTNSHHFCVRCERRYSSWARLLQHLGDSKSHNFCSDCEIDFASPEALQAHLQCPPHASFCKCISVVLLITLLVVLMGVLVAYLVDRLRY